MWLNICHILCTKIDAIKITKKVVVLDELRVFLRNTFSIPPPGKVDRVQLGLPIGNKSCLSMLVGLNKGF